MTDQRVSGVPALEKEDLLRVTLASIGDGVISTDAEGRVTFLNGVAEMLTGWTLAEASGRSLSEVFNIVNEYTRRPVENPAFRALADGVIVGLANHTILIAKDGTERPIDDSAAPIRNTGGQSLGSVLVFRDVSERKRSEADRARLAAIVESSDDAIVSKTLDGLIRTWNVGAERIFGYTADEAVGQSITLVIPPELLDEERQILERLRRGERVDHFETVRVAKDGRRLDVSLTISPIRDADGRLIGASKIARDVTARNAAARILRAEEAERRFFAELSAATQSLSEPSAIMASVARLLAEHLHADRCAYAEVADESIYIITGDYARGVASIVGTWPVEAFGDSHLAMMKAGLPYVVTDTDTDPRISLTDLPAYRATEIRAVVCVPLLKNGRFTSAMAVHQRVPRFWTREEVSLVTTVVGRCWEALERARVERTLRDAEGRLRLMIESATDYAIFSLNTDGRIATWNAGAERIFGWAEADIVGQNGDVLFTPEDRKAGIPTAEIARATAEGRAEDERWHLRKDGTRFYASGVMTPIRDGFLHGFTKVCRDTTEQKRAEAETARLADTLGLALAAAHLGTWEWDPETDVMVLSPRTGAIYGVDVQVVHYREDLRRLLHPDDRERAKAAALHAVANRTDYDIEYRVIREGEEPVWISARGRGVYDATGRLNRMLGVVQDVTQRKQAEKEQEKLVNELRESDRRKDEFLALLAHELRNPLAPIRNGLQVLRLAEDPELRRESQDIMDRQMGHMVRLIDDLLDIARINRNKMELRRSRIMLSDAVSSAVEIVRPALDEAHHRLDIILPSEPVFLDADLTRLAQIFGNLLSNSVKYTPSGGQIRIVAQLELQNVVVTVEDNGLGIPSTALENIFDMFSQVDRSVERSTGGLGIGLALVRGLVEMHGGSITATSEGMGEGSTFKIILPLPKVPLAKHPSQPIPTLPLSGRRILVVDDNQDGANSLSIMLRLIGNEVQTAYDGAQAIAFAETFRPDVVLMDIGMPRMNGLEVTREVRQHPWGQEMIIIALTGWGQDSDREKSQSAGCDGHLVKPVTLPDLEQLLLQFQ